MTIADNFYDRILEPLFESKKGRAATTSEKKDFQLRILALNWRCLRHPQAGGAEVNLFQQADHWIQHGHEVTVFTSNPGKEHAPERIENFAGIQILRFGGQFSLYIFALLYVLFFSWRYDVILDISNGIPFFTPLVTRKPVTLMVHHVHQEQWQKEFSDKVARIGWMLESQFVPWLYSDKPVITVSPTTRDAMMNIGYHPDQIHIVYNGLDATIPPFREMSPAPRIVYIGRVKAYKRLEILIRAVWVLQEEFPNIQLDIAGSGDNIERLRELTRYLGVEHCVTLHGYISDVKKAELLSKGWIFATPSMQEGWGLSVIEANAYGCPTVAYNVPGLSASIPHNETGLLAENDEEFIDNIARLLSDKELRERLSAGAVYWATLFDWESSALSTLSVMTEAN